MDGKLIKSLATRVPKSLDDLVVAVDTETYYDRHCSVTELGNDAYVNHPDFYCYLVSIAGPNDIEYVGPPEHAPWKEIESYPWVSWNTPFDFTVLASLSEKIGFTLPLYWADASHCSVYLQHPRSLGMAAKAWLGESMDKQIRDDMKGKHFDELPSEDAKRVKEYALNDARLTRQLYLEMSPFFPDHERHIAHMVMRQGVEGIKLDCDKVDNALREWKGMLWKCDNDIPWTREGKAATSPIEMAKACRGAGIEPPKSWAEKSPELQVWETRYAGTFPWVEAIRERRKLNRVISLAERLKQRVRPDGVLGFGLKYHGAPHTGRLSGDSKVNLQALNKKKVGSFNVREFFIPKKGSCFIIADLAQIEPRCSAWLTQDFEFLDLVRSGVDLYEISARRVLGYTDPRPLKEVDPGLRDKAKAVTLGLCYGLGSKAFQAYAATFGQEVSDEEAASIVFNYRKKNLPVVEFWGSLDHNLKANLGGEFVYRLPSGRAIRYTNIRRARDKFGKLKIVVDTTKAATGQDIRYLWGSKIYENIVQGFGRDVFMDCLLRIEQKLGEVTRFSVHDEGVFEVPSNRGSTFLKLVQHEMSVAPTFCPDLPIACEAQMTETYTK